MEESWIDPDLDGLDELDVFGSPGGSAEEARQAGDDGVAGLDKITAQMAGGEHRPEQQEMCRAVAGSRARMSSACSTSPNPEPLITWPRTTLSP